MRVPSVGERLAAAESPWEMIAIMEGGEQGMFPEIGHVAVTVQEVKRWARNFCEGRITWQQFEFALPVYVNPQEVLMQYIDDEEASYQRMRDEAHRLTRRTYNPQAAALPQSLKGKVRVSIIGPDGKPQQIAEFDKISFGAFPGKTVGVCKCDMKDLMSGVPHLDDCPEKKR